VSFQGALTFSSNIRLGRDFSRWKVDLEENDLESFYFWITITIDIIFFIQSLEVNQPLDLVFTQAPV
jgi:hypothetical protein